MCLAIPGIIKEVRGSHYALVDFDGIEKEINIELVEIKRGDWVIVHAGFAIQKLTAKDAGQILKLYAEIN